ncbi:hypothetical protein DL765_000245 [Monosporascus sp. GIB2]|nr:hypothetical protein DL765_000245 [Monosporascus sp. GIB2]
MLLTGPAGRDHVHVLGSRPSLSAAQILQDSAHQPTIYEIALQELRQLESEPLCHRVAARLLVSNCELLEGKDEATVLTDSGRQIRDFVDSYAASLAICDLERGSFVIPRECAKFREPVLSQLPSGNAVHLHVTSAEIDDCLSGLGSSDSAWNTWVSYRHKALRFCDAARADYDKAQHIMLFQRLAEIMKQMTDSAEQELEIRIQQFDKRAREWADRIGDLSPTVDRLGERLKGIEAMLSGGLAGALEKSTDAVNGGIENAVSLQRMLETMMKDVMNSHAEAASAHEHSLQVMSRRAESEMETAMAMVAAAVTSGTALQSQLELSRLRAVELERRQDNLEHGLQWLADVTEGLSTKYDDHTELLHRAQNMTSEILSTLENTAASASFIGGEDLGGAVEGFEDAQGDLTRHPRALDPQRDEPLDQVRSTAGRSPAGSCRSRRTHPDLRLKLPCPGDTGSAADFRRQYPVRDLIRWTAAIGTCQAVTLILFLGFYILLSSLCLIGSWIRTLPG